MTRADNRGPDKLRPWKITSRVIDHAEGSALVECGRTRVLCTASIENKVPAFLKGTSRGWITAEYAMLPRATQVRSPRERGNRVAGRTLEIQRLIGRSLRSIADLELLGERSIIIDCDVLQADGGTRVASITGGWVALHDAVTKLLQAGEIPRPPLLDSVAAVSVGVVERENFLDLDYEEDSTAEVDMNVVMTGQGRLVEVQATAERASFSLARLNALIRLAANGITELRELQQKAIRWGDGEMREENS